MILDNPINENYRVQSLGMKFNSIVQQNELIIQVICEGDNSQYTGKMAQNPHVSFDQIVQHLDARTFGIIQKKQDVLRLEIMQQEVELYSMSKLQLNELTQTVRNLSQRQNDFGLMMDAQINQLNKIKDQIKELKDNIKNPIYRQQQFQKITQLQSDSIQDLKDQMNKFKLQIKKTIEQIKKINEDSLQSEIMKIQNQIIQIKIQMNKSIQQVRDNWEIKINEQQKTMIKNSREIDEIMKEMQKLSSLLGFSSQEKLGLGNKRIQRINQIQKVQCKSQKIIKQPLKRQQKIQYKWSQNLKSDRITIKGNVITLSWNDGKYREFCLLNASFTNTLKTKQSWAIQIKKMPKQISLGVCKKDIMKNSFIHPKLNFDETYHEVNMHGSNFFFSHSQKWFMDQSFRFSSGDIIYIEYDPIDLKLRFSKNKSVDYCELPIIAPAQNDPYHPYVELKGQNSSVKLIHPVQFPNEDYDKRNKGFWSGLFGA